MVRFLYITWNLCICLSVQNDVVIVADTSRKWSTGKWGLCGRVVETLIQS